MSQDLLSFLDDSGPGDQAKAIESLPDFSAGHTNLHNQETTGKDPLGLEDPWSNETSYANSPAGQPGLDTVEDDDDFGDFENASPASAAAASLPSAQPRSDQLKTSVPTKEVRSPFPPKAARPPKSAFSSQDKPSARKDKTGSHPFAGRMDLLFEADDDDYDAGADELGDLANNPEAAMAYSKRIIAEQQESSKGKGKGKMAAGQSGGFVDLEEAKEKGSGGPGVASSTLKKKDPNVLFDADDVSDDGGRGEDDDFGDFETWDEPVKTASALSKQTQSCVEPLNSGLDLLGLDDEPKKQPPPKAAQTRPFAKPSKPAQPYGSKKATASSSSNVQQQDEDFWDDFEPTSASATQRQRDQPPKPQQDDNWPDFEPSAPSPTQPQHPSPSPPKQPQLPPANIPPPLTLLTLFPTIFSSADAALFTTFTRLDLKSRTMLLSHPASHQFLRGHLAHCRVLARIIAGRKLRWKRDQRLSQGMRIGPASAGGKGGMKLAGLDKSEVAKEDREVLDVVRLYRQQVGKLRTAVSAASAAPGLPKLPPVPEIGEVMAVKALKQGEGGITAREACALCGLKREERVVKVDDAPGARVEDSFGEWWLQGMGMHVDCRDFWVDWEAKLKSR